MKRKELWIAGLLLLVSNTLKICSFVALCSTGYFDHPAPHPAVVTKERNELVFNQPHLSSERCKKLSA